MKPNRIVVGVDYSQESLRAADHALAIARRTGAPLTLAYVGLVPDSKESDAWHDMLRQRFAERRGQLEHLRTRMSGQGVEVSHVVKDGYADTGLADAARELEADLIVVGTHGRSGVQRVLLGSVAEKTARLADSSVLVTRGDAPVKGYGRIVVGTDYSELGDRAIQRAFALAAPDAHVLVVYAWSAPYVEYDLDGRAYAGLREAAEVQAKQQRERILAMPRPEGVTVRFDLWDGVPFVVLEELSRTADLVAVGSHGRRGLRRFVLGSVAEATIRHAHCSVLVAR